MSEPTKVELSPSNAFQICAGGHVSLAITGKLQESEGESRRCGEVQEKERRGGGGGRGGEGRV